MKYRYKPTTTTWSGSKPINRNGSASCSREMCTRTRKKKAKFGSTARVQHYSCTVRGGWWRNPIFSLSFLPLWRILFPAAAERKGVAECAAAADRSTRTARDHILTYCSFCAATLWVLGSPECFQQSYQQWVSGFLDGLCLYGRRVLLLLKRGGVVWWKSRENIKHNPPQTSGLLLL